MPVVIDQILSRTQQEFNTARAALLAEVANGRIEARAAMDVLETARQFAGWAAVDYVQQAVHKAQAGTGAARRE